MRFIKELWLVHTVGKSNVPKIDEKSAGCAWMYMLTLFNAKKTSRMHASPMYVGMKTCRDRTGNVFTMSHVK